jgi:transposase
MDLGKRSFHLIGMDARGKVIMRQQLSRGRLERHMANLQPCKRVSRSKVLEFFGGLSPCLIGLEACPSAHYWSRGLQALGHTVKLMPPSYVKAYLKRSKNDANDAAAICEAVIRPSMRFVPIKTQVQQTGLIRN